MKVTNGHSDSFKFANSRFHLISYMGLVTGPLLLIHGDLKTFPLLSSLFLFSIFKRSTSSEPGELAKPSDQGLFETCTRHAIGKAIVDGFMEGFFHSQKLDFDQDDVIVKLIAIFGDTCPRHPTDYNNKTFTTIDMKTNVKYSIDLTVEKLDGCEEVREDMKDKLNQKFTYVLVFSTATWQWQLLQWLFSGPPHCVYIKNLIPPDQNNPWLAFCYNSHSNNPYFGHVLEKPDNLIYKVSCKAREEPK